MINPKANNAHALNPWDQRYDSETYFYGTEPNDFLVEQSHLIPTGAQILCLAEGEGRNAVYLAALPAQPSVLAVDSSLTGLGKALRLASERHVRIQTQQVDLKDFDIGESRWDAIVSIWCHVPSALRGELHKNVVRGLKPQGLFILEAYTPDQLKYGTGGPKDPDLLMSQALLTAELSGLDFLIATEREREVQEGLGHSGQSAVVQLVGQKLT